MTTETNEREGIYCRPCIAQALDAGLAQPSAAAALLPYHGPVALCSICMERPAEVYDPSVAEEVQ